MSININQICVGDHQTIIIRKPHIDYYGPRLEQYSPPDVFCRRLRETSPFSFLLVKLNQIYKKKINTLSENIDKGAKQANSFYIRLVGSFLALSIRNSDILLEELERQQMKTGLKCVLLRQSQAFTRRKHIAYTNKDDIKNQIASGMPHFCKTNSSKVNKLIKME